MLGYYRIQTEFYFIK